VVPGRGMMGEVRQLEVGKSNTEVGGLEGQSPAKTEGEVVHTIIGSLREGVSTLERGPKERGVKPRAEGGLEVGAGRS